MTEDYEIRKNVSRDTDGAAIKIDSNLCPFDLKPATLDNSLQIYCNKIQRYYLGHVDCCKTILDNRGVGGLQILGRLRIAKVNSNQALSIMHGTEECFRREKSFVVELTFHHPIAKSAFARIFKKVEMIDLVNTNI
jgi:hypothetical protein